MRHCLVKIEFEYDILKFVVFIWDELFFLAIYEVLHHTFCSDDFGLFDSS